MAIPISMKLAELLQQNRTIRVIGFDDAPFDRRSPMPVGLAGIVCAGTRFEGMLWGAIEADGWDATETICNLLLKSKFFPQLHLLLIDGIGFGGFNLVNLPVLATSLQLPCVAIMRRQPNLSKIKLAMQNLPEPERRWQILCEAGEIYHIPPFYFQVRGAPAEVVGKVLHRITDCGYVPEALRLAHLIGAAFIKGESGRQA
jgi:uncharacterized protein